MESHLGLSWARFSRLLPTVLTILLATLLTIILVLLLQGNLPQYTLVFYLFNAGTEQVGIDLYGGIAPTVACLWLVPLLRKSRHKRVFWASLAATVIVPTLTFSSLSLTSGGTSIGVTGGEAAIVLGGLFGSAYGILRRKWVSILNGALECFFVGAVGLFASDIILTLSGQIQAPYGAVVWGGGGTHDLVLWFGLYMALSFTFLRILKDRLRLVYGWVRGKMAPAPEVQAGRSFRATCAQ